MVWPSASFGANFTPMPASVTGFIRRKLIPAVCPASEGERQVLRMAKLFMWSILDKFSPARRVLLLIALILFFPSMHLTGFSTSGIFWGCILLFVLLVLEVTDRVVMKRDLQIAKEIQVWLLPPAPPQVPGL